MDLNITLEMGVALVVLAGLRVTFSGPRGGRKS